MQIIMGFHPKLWCVPQAENVIEGEQLYASIAVSSIEYIV
jgi:hypothetical protein